jgi:hypothetical protein
LAQVFISYAREDEGFVRKLAQDLRQKSVSLWLDKLDLGPGPWDDQIQVALAACSHFIVILSPASVDSQNVKDEIHFARKANKVIIPVYYQDCEIPFRIDRWQLIDFRNDRKGALAELLDILTDREDSESAIKKETQLKAIKDSSVDRDSRDPQLESFTKQRVEIIRKGDFSSLSPDRWAAAIDAFAAVIGISPQDIEVYGVYEGSIVFDLGVSFKGAQRLRSLLEANNAELRLLEIEKVIFEEESGLIEEWILKDGEFFLVTSTRSAETGDVYIESQRTTDLEYDVFLSHAEDENGAEGQFRWIDLLQQELETRLERLWKKPKIGQSSEVIKTPPNCVVIIPIISPSYVRSEHFQELVSFLDQAPQAYPIKELHLGNKDRVFKVMKTSLSFFDVEEPRIRFDSGNSYEFFEVEEEENLLLNLDPSNHYKFRTKLYELANDVCLMLKMIDAFQEGHSEVVSSLKRDWHNRKMRQIDSPGRSISSAGRRAMTLMKSGEDEVLPTILLSYSHKNETDKEQLLTHLRDLVRTKSIDIWSEDRIRAESNWREEFTKVINQADAAILLVTADFLASEFISDQEVSAFLKRREEEGLSVFPVIARQCAWKGVPWLREMEVKPKDGKPVWRRGGQPDEALKAVVKEMHDLLKAKSRNLSYYPTKADQNVIPFGLAEKSPSKIIRAKPSGQKVIKFRRLPIFESIAAGRPTHISDESIVGFLDIYEDQDGELDSRIQEQSLDINLLGKRRLYFSEGFDYFVVQVSGDSMDRAGILSGDYVILRRQVGLAITLSSGDIVAAVFRDEDDKATLKRYSRESDRVVFEPESSNISHRSISLRLQAFADDNPQVKVVGIAIAVLKPQPPASAPGEPQG